MKDRHYLTLSVAKTHNPQSVFSYYGGKSKVSGKYPLPEHEWIIEPFGGAAAYSWRHREHHQVWVNDIDPVTISIWQFLQLPTALEELTSVCKAHTTLETGTCISQICSANTTPGLVSLLQAELGRGFQGRHAVQDKITAWGVGYYWPRLLPKFRIVIPVVRNWKITNLPYQKLEFHKPATWFIDPPYNNIAGQRYRHHDVDFKELGIWCRARVGQVMVCENAGADWLPFRTLTTKGLGMAQNNKKAPGEVCWMNTPDSSLFP